MSAQTDFNQFPFSNIIVGHIKADSSLEEFVQSILEWQNFNDHSFIIGFDRSLWTKLTNGLVPPQLYTFEPSLAEYEGLFFLAIDKSNANLDQLSSFVKVIFDESCQTAEICGELKKASFVEDEFKDGRYLSFLTHQGTPLSLVDGCRRLSPIEDQNYQLFLTEEVYSLDDYLSSNKDKILSGFYFYIPSIEKLKELPELLGDIEKIHLSENITGIRC